MSENEKNQNKKEKIPYKWYVWIFRIIWIIAIVGFIILLVISFLNPSVPIITVIVWTFFGPSLLIFIINLILTVFVLIIHIKASNRNMIFIPITIQIILSLIVSILIMILYGEEIISIYLGYNDVIIIFFSFSTYILLISIIDFSLIYLYEIAFNPESEYY